MSFTQRIFRVMFSFHRETVSLGLYHSCLTLVQQTLVQQPTHFNTGITKGFFFIDYIVYPENQVAFAVLYWAKALANTFFAASQAFLLSR